MARRDISTAFIKALGKAVRAERVRLRWSQEKLCDRAELDRTYVSGLERGVRAPNVRTVYRVAAALDVKLSKLIADAEMATRA